MLWYQYKQKCKGLQRGAIMVLFAVLLPVLCGFMGFSVDLGLAYVERGKMQDIADAAALAGAAHLNDEDRDTTIADAVKAYAEANGLKLDNKDLVEKKTDSDWNTADTLAKGQDVIVAYGVVSVAKDGGEPKERVRVRITKRAPLFFFNVLGDFSDGIVVAAKAAAEGNTGDKPVFRIIGRNGVYDHFFNLSGASAEGDPDKWIKGSIYAGNMLRASYKQHNPQEARNMISVDGYIFADMLNTGLPVKTGVSGTESEPSDDRIFRSDYVRKMDGDKWLSGFDALTKSDFKGAGWGGTAQQLAEQKLSEYSSTLSAYVGNEEIKRKARNREDGYRYICNQAVKKDLYARLVPTVGLEFDRLKNGAADTEWESYSSYDTNHQYSNIEKDKQEIDVLYVEIQGDSINQNLKNSREGAVWLGCNDRIKKLKKIGTIIVELKTTPTEV
ncbi:MAG: pilus assembly protein TadG-related protein, partial [Phascolarctobacterium sp.]